MFLNTKKSIQILFLSVFSLMLFLCAQAEAKPNYKYASIVVDADSNQVLSERYADKKLHPASLTKMMTLYLVFDALKRGEWSLKTRLYVSQNAQNQVPSKLGVRKGERITVEDAIKALVVKSANDVAVVVAENYAGSESVFATEMTRVARQLGMSRTTFKNASGLHHRYQISTARDMAVLGLALIEDYPDYYDYFGLTSFSYKGQRYRGHNALMKSYPGMDGLKTGYIRASGFNLVSSAKRNGKRLVGVVFGGKKSRSRNRHMAALLDQGFRVVGSGTYMAQNKVGTPPVPSQKPVQALTIAALDTNIDIGADAVPVEEVLIEVLEEGSAATPRLDVSNGWDVVRSRVAREETSLTPETRDRIITAVKELKEMFVKEAQATQNMASIEPAIGGSIVSGMILPTVKPVIAKGEGDWAVQVGAFNSRAQSDKAIRHAKSLVPHLLDGARAVNLQGRNKSTGRYFYRARLTGLDKDYAQAVCSEISDCLVVSP